MTPLMSLESGFGTVKSDHIGAIIHTNEAYTIHGLLYMMNNRIIVSDKKLVHYSEGVHDRGGDHFPRFHCTYTRTFIC